MRRVSLKANDIYWNWLWSSTVKEDEEGEDGEDEGIDEDVEELDVLLVNKVRYISADIRRETLDLVQEN